MPASAKASKPSSDKVAPVIAIVGPEPYLQRRALAEVLDRLPDDVQRVDLDGPQAEAADVFEELRSFAMFGGSRVVVVRDADAFISNHRESLEDYLAAPSEPNVLVLRATTMPKNTRVYKACKAVGEIIPCETPKAGQLPRWLVKQAKTVHGFMLTPPAADLLANLIGTDLGSLDEELGKLAIQFEGGEVGPEAFADHVAFRREQQMWVLTDALANGDAAGAMRIWQQLRATDASAEFRAVTWLGIWVEKSTAALALLRRGEKPFSIAKTLRIWPADNVNPLLNTAKALGPTGLRKAAGRLVELDYRSKSGLGEQGRSVDQFIAEVASQARLQI